jgi:hypothetical protein
MMTLQTEILDLKRKRSSLRGRKKIWILVSSTNSSILKLNGSWELKKRSEFSMKNTKKACLHTLKTAPSKIKGTLEQLSVSSS